MWIGMAATISTERPYHHGALREALMAEGLKLLGERSAEDLSLREIARNVGVSATAVYRHFPDKGALLRALSQQGLEQLAAAQEAASDAAGGGAAGFRATGQAYVAFALANPALFRLIFAHPPAHDPMDAESSRISKAMSRLLDDAAALAPSPDGARVFALQNWALVHGLAMLMLDGQVPSDPAIIRAVVDARHDTQAKAALPARREGAKGRSDHS